MKSPKCCPSICRLWRRMRRIKPFSGRRGAAVRRAGDIGAQREQMVGGSGALGVFGELGPGGAVMSDPRLSSYRSGWIPAALVVLASAALPAGADSLDQITVQAQRDRLKQEVNTFVSNAIVQTRYDETLERWNNEKVCPLVAGLNKEQGKFVLARVSQIARDAGAPLGSEKCKANFFVVFTKDPEPGLKQLADHHDAAAFNYETGAQLKKFV